jgi:hypothetical protein
MTMNVDSDKFDALKLQAEAIFDQLGSDRGIKAIEDYCDNLITADELESRLTRIEAEESDTLPCHNHRFDQYIKVAADDVSRLRRPDVFRVMELACSKSGMAKYLKSHRMDLADEIEEVFEELTGQVLT